LNKSEVIRLLEEMGASPKRSLGQNFLVDDNIIKKIVEKAVRLKASEVIEIGPGLGSLTNVLLAKSIRPKLIELDKTFVNYWKNRALEVVEGDVLKIDWRKLSLQDNALLISNLPYQVSASIVILASTDLRQVEDMIFMFQKEVAQRIVARNKKKEYGLLSVVAQCAWDIDLVTDVGPSCFYPRPNIASRVLHFRRKSQSAFVNAKFVKFVKICFEQRRKLLAPKLVRWWGSENQAHLLQLKKDLGISDKARAEELSPEVYEGLFKGHKLSGKNGN